MMKFVLYLCLGLTLINKINAAAAPTIEQTPSQFQFTDEEIEQFEIPEDFIDEIEQRLNKYWADDKNTEMELRKLIKSIVIGSIIKGAILG